MKKFIVYFLHFSIGMLLIPQAFAEKSDDMVFFQGNEFHIAGDFSLVSPEESKCINGPDVTFVERLCGILRGSRWYADNWNNKNSGEDALTITMLDISSEERMKNAENVVYGFSKFPRYYDDFISGARTEFTIAFPSNEILADITGIEILKKADGSPAGIGFFYRAQGEKQSPGELGYEIVFQSQGKKTLGYFNYRVDSGIFQTTAPETDWAKFLYNKGIAQNQDIESSIFTDYIQNHLKKDATQMGFITELQNIVINGQKTPFTDVATNYKFYDALTYGLNHKIILGYTDGSMRPEQPINRAEFVKVMINQNSSLQVTNIPGNCFSDVRAGDWYEFFVCRSKSLGLVKGYADGTFRPAKTIILAEALKIFYTAYNISIPTGANWYTPYITQAEKDHLLDDLSKDPLHQMTRGETLELIYRFVNK